MIIYIKLYAGLGNQLFQYAYGKSLEMQGKKVRYMLNRTYDKNKNCFDLPECFLVDESQILMPKTKLSLVLQKFYAKYIARTWHTGFYQEYRFVENVPKSLFVFKKEREYSATPIFEQIAGTNSVSLHIRGGDYLDTQTNAEFGNICTTEYYKAAVDSILKNVQNPQFFIFSNDIHYSQKIIEKIAEQTHIYLTLIPQCDFSIDPAYELFLMSQCKHNIIANSTYSWWGTFLNQTENKIVIAPQKWKNTNFNSDILIPTKWLRFS